MKTPYQLASLTTPSLMQRLFRQWPEENAVIEINNLLASKPILQIDKSEVTAILNKYAFDFYNLFTKNIYEFYAALLKLYLSDKWLDEDEHKNLLHLKGLLGLRDQDVDFINIKVSGEIYRTSFERAIQDGRLSDESEETLDKLWANLQLPKKAASKISEKVRGNFVRRFMDEITSRQRMSPEEDRELNAISKSLKVNVRVNKDTQQTLDRYKLLWQLENEPLTPIEVFITLQKGEQCYYAGLAEWHEDRTNRGEKYWKQIDHGDFFLTNKRVIFSGRVKNTSIKLDKILSFSLRQGGVQLHKDAGKSPLLIFEKDSDVVSLLLTRIMKASNW